MKITDINLELEAADMERALAPYVAAFRFYNKGTLPARIILPRLELVRAQTSTIPPIFSSFPVVYSGEEHSYDAGGQGGARRDYKVTRTVRGAGNSAGSEPKSKS